MTEEEKIRGVLSHILEGSSIFERIKKDIDTFFEQYAVVKWLSLSQAATIHEMFMSKEIDELLVKYKKLQLKRASEKDKWQKEVDGKMAIDYFCEMIKGFCGSSDKYKALISKITRTIGEDFRLSIPETHYPLIYQSLIRTFDYIFITQLRISKMEAQNV